MLIPILSALARAGGGTIVLGIALALVTYLQLSLVSARATSPFMAALHPANALLIFTLSLALTLRGSCEASAKAPPGRESTLGERIRVSP